jgi:hypothetical protein
MAPGEIESINALAHAAAPSGSMSSLMCAAQKSAMIQPSNTTWVQSGQFSHGGLGNRSEQTRQTLMSGEPPWKDTMIDV